MKQSMNLVPAVLVAAALLTCASAGSSPREKSGENVQLGNFSVSLTVKDLGVSRAFYEKLGLKVVGGDGRKYAILQNDTSTIGLFEGMFEKNSLTFNPGWDRACKTLPDFQDVREIQRTLKDRGLTPTVSADESSTGPAFCTLLDPDGNPILIDQHVPSPAKRTKGSGGK